MDGAGDDHQGGEWWRGAAIYQVYPRSFADTNGDGVGDLPGITRHLDHIASLGVEAVWISPFFTSPMHDFGYDVADYRDVDPLFGTLADFDALLERAHGLGLKVLIDQIYSHTSDQHAWFAESRADRNNAKADWYVWADPRADGTPPNNWQSVFGGPAWTWDARRGQYYLHNFLTQQPDLNLHNPAVQDAILDVARFWLDRGVDGFRLDALNFGMHDRQLRDNPVNPVPGKRTRPFDFQDKVHNMSQPELVGFIERLAGVIRGYDGSFTVAEVGGDKAIGEMRAFTQGTARLNTSYGFDYLYAGRLTPDLVRRSMAEWPNAPDAGWPSWAFSNHDAPRAVTRWAAAEDRAAMARLLMLLLVALRGNIFLYQGEELGLPQVDIPFERLQDPEAIRNWPLTLARDGARTPMPWTGEAPHGGFSSAEPWLPVDPAHLALSVAAQEAEAGSMLHWTRALLALRKAHPALRLGSFTPIATNHDQLLLFERAAGDERLICAFNLGGESVSLPVAAGELLAACGDFADGALARLSGAVFVCA